MIKLNFLLNRLYLVHFLSFLAIVSLSGCTSQVVQSPSLLSEKNMATVNITRESQIWGAAIPASIYINSTYIGMVGNGGSLHWKVPAGQTTISTSKGIGAIEFQRHDPSTISFNAQTNKTYNVKVYSPWQITFLTPGFELKLMNS